MLLYYLKNPKRTGALCSSSQRLSQAITDNIEIEKAHHIIEVGPGMGAFTKVILKKKDPHAHFFAVEINPKLAEHLRNKIKNIDVEVGSAEFLPSIMQQKNMESADIVISGIPWALLGVKEQHKTLKGIYDSLKQGGHFATFAYILPTPQAKRFRKKLFKLFSEVKTSKVVWQNIPPAFVYYCKK